MASGDKAGKVKVELTLDLTSLRAQVEEARKIIGGIADAGVETGGRSTRRRRRASSGATEHTADIATPIDEGHQLGAPRAFGMLTWRDVRQLRDVSPAGSNEWGLQRWSGWRRPDHIIDVEAIPVSEPKQNGFPAGGVPPIIPPTGGGPPPTGMTPTGGSGGGGMFGGLGTAGITQAMRQGGWVASVLSRLGIPASVASSFGLIAGTLTSAASAAAIPLAALAATLLSLRRAIKSANEAAELYAKTLQSGGLPLGFVSWRSSLASILGVSEDEVLSFAKAVDGLGERVNESTDIIARNAPELAKTSWEMRMLKLEWQAFWSEFSKAMSPVLRQILRDISAFLKPITMAAELINKLSEAKRNAQDLKLQGYEKLADLLPEGGIKGFIKEWITQSREELSKAPEPIAWSRRLPGSDWERKGLVLGGFGMAGGVGIEEPSKQTANNTKQIAKSVGTIVTILRFLSRFNPTSGPPFWPPAFSNHL